MAPRITVNYSINPPDGVTTSNSLKKQSKIEVIVPSSSASDNTTYYENLRHAIAEAKAQVGAELTSWRDAVGSLENTKEAKKQSKNGSDEEEEYEEE